MKKREAVGDFKRMVLGYEFEYAGRKTKVAPREDNVDAFLEAFGELTSERVVKSKLKVLSAFPVLYQGWECDDWAWTVQYGDKVRVFGTNHGALEALDVRHLKKLINTYIDAIGQTEDALHHAGYRRGFQK